MTAFALTRRLPTMAPNVSTRKFLPYMLIGLALLFAAALAGAATNEGTALQAAYEALDELANGYGKQILTLMGFIVTAIAYLAANAASVVMKFIGYAIFLGAAFGAAITLVGAVI